MFRSTLNRVKASLVILCASALCAGCNETSQTSAKVDTIRVGWEKTTADAALYHMKDLASHHGLNVELVQFARHPDIKTALVNGSIDFGSVTTPDLAFAIDSGSTAITALAGEGRGGDYLQCRNSVAPAAWDDLKGSKYRIKTFAGGIAWLKLMATLFEHGITPQEIGLQKIAGGPPDMALLIKTNEADIGTNVDPFVAQGKINGDSDYCALDINSSKIGSLNALFAVRTEVLKQNPALVNKALGLYLASVRDLASDASLWASVYESYSGLPANIASQAIGHVKLNIGMPQKEILAASEFMRQQGLIKQNIQKSVQQSLHYAALAEATGRTPADLGSEPN